MILYAGKTGRRYRRAALITASTPTLLGMSLMVASPAPARGTRGEADKGGFVEEIVVIARKREESPREAPICSGRAI